jgi:hypothetical protein
MGLLARALRPSGPTHARPSLLLSVESRRRGTHHTKPHQVPCQGGPAQGGQATVGGRHGAASGPGLSQWRWSGVGGAHRRPMRGAEAVAHFKVSGAATIGRMRSFRVPVRTWYVPRLLHVIVYSMVNRAI